MDDRLRDAKRLADYVVIIAFDESQLRHGVSVGCIVQRFPQEDWPDVSLSPSLDVFSQPNGWILAAEPRTPSFFVNTLTDMIGARQFAYCLQVYEPCCGSADDVEGSSEVCEVSTNDNVLYKPKVIVILSRFSYFDLFRNCLNRIHLALLEDNGTAESMIATLISSVCLAPGLPAVPFTFASERLSVRAPSYPTVPVTADKIALFVHHLGSIYNLLLILCAVLTDHKLLMRSSSLSRLSDSCFALRCLLYPFDYPHTFVPVLPELLIDYVESPTPYIMGVSHSVRIRCSELDAVVVDIDIGAVHVPSNIVIPRIPQQFAHRLISSLQLVLYPGLATADDAWKTGQPPLPSSEVQDKRIRACFLLFFVDLLWGYRCCLEVVRLHSPPLIVFHKSAFLGLRDLSTCQLLRSLLESLLFQSFIAERGIPYRICDLFDELVGSSTDKPYDEATSKVDIMRKIASVAEKLMENERQEAPFSMTLMSQKRSLAVVPAKLNELDATLVTRLVNSHVKSVSLSPIAPRRVPKGSCFQMQEERLGAVSRRLQVLANCLHYIFDSKLSDARKMMCAVELSMRSVIARVALCQLLWVNLSPVSRATLLPQQFELLIRLINCALEQESREDEHGIAYAMLHLSNIYCRRLTPGVHQFAYTCIQDHDVWDNQQFWEAAFFHDVHRQLRRLYGDLKINNDCPFSLKENVCDTWNLSEEPSCMDIASERLANLSKLNEVEIRQKAAEENSIVFGQAKHYINLMVYLQVPLDVSKLRRVNVRELERKFDRNLKRTDSDDETEYSPSESDIGSGFMESDCNDLGSSAVKWISRLIDRICSAAGLDQSQIGRLCGEIPGFVALHIDNLEQVYTESKRLSPMHKPKLLQPALLTPSESVIVGGLRVFLLNDGRVTSQQACDQQIQNVLPAEGAIFLTNYRVIFKGQPCDPFFSEQVAIRTMAIMSIMKEKQISDQLIQEVSQRDGIRARIAVQLHDAFQIRSTSFQLMKIAFDEEVSSVKAEEFIQTLMTLRWPVSLPHTMFAFSAASSLLSSTLATSNSKHKYQTMKDLKKALMRNPLKDKKRLTTRPTATKFPSRDGNGGTLPAVFNETSSSLIYSGGSSGADYLDLSGAMDYSTSNLHRHYLIDYDRLGLIHRPYRLSNVIHRHDLSKGYPAVIVLPSTVMDENLFKISKGFKHGRFPVITWKSEDDALLIRGAGFASQTVVARLKKQANLLAYPEQQQSALGGSRLSVYNRDNSSAISIEGQEFILNQLAAISPNPTAVDIESLLSDSVESLLSFNSIFTSDGASVEPGTPDIYRKSQTSDFTRHAASFVRSSGGKYNSRQTPTTSSNQCSEHFASSANLRRPNAVNVFPIVRPPLSLTRSSLYVFGDKSQSKMLKLGKNCEFIPTTYPTAHNVKIAFKKFSRALCPSWVFNDDQSASFYKQVDDSGWLQMVASLLHLASAITVLIDIQRSSVALCLEDGWDATCQISALSQIMLDPYYRTHDGFRVLIEKEWLSFGHRFSHRANHSAASQSSGIAPMFLMFLDAVHQILVQYPSAFEFNDFFLRFLAYHSASTCFRTFVLDSEADRITVDLLTISAADPRSASVWTYISEKRQKSPIFENFCYTSDVYGVLRPQTSIASIELWEFYSEDHLAHGSSYDIEVAEVESQQREDEQFECLTEIQTPRTKFYRVIDASYRSIHLLRLDAFSFQLNKFSKLLSLLGGEGENNTEIWNKIVAITDDKGYTGFPDHDERHMLENWRRHMQRAVHKKETVKLLLRGISHQSSSSRLRDNNAAASTGHRFMQQSVTPGDVCVVCHQNISENIVRSVQRCSGCGMVSHEKCVLAVSSVCFGNLEYRNTSASAKQDAGLDAMTPTSVEAVDRTLTISAGRSCPNITHSGVLMKKGVTFKMWKPRWFVLDWSRHQLRYYESEMDASCRGIIELADITNIEISSNHTLRKPLIEIRTNRRIYSLLAGSKTDGEIWMEKLTAALKD